MKDGLTSAPRVFGASGKEIRDFGKLELDSWEMISLKTPSGKECDLTATDWGFYLGSSLNGRMAKEGFRTALVRNGDGKFFVNVVEREKIALFEAYLQEQKSTVIRWLDEAAV